MNRTKNNFQKPELSVDELSHALYEVSQQLQQANLELQRQKKEQIEFYANISHDLRSPITAISNSIEYLMSADSLSQKDLQNTLTVMQHRTAYLEHLINDIFLLSSLDSSNVPIRTEPVDIRFYLEDYFYLCEADSKYQNAHLALTISNDLDLTLQIDPRLMHRVLDNLFTNALKYAKEAPSITLGAYVDKPASKLVIYVADTGIGIAGEHLDKIFDRSYMIEKARTPKSASSSGFGLSIVKSVVKHHNGTVTCESELGKGSKFIITLPIEDMLHEETN